MDRYSVVCSKRIELSFPFRGVTRALIGGEGVYSYIRVLPDGFLLKLSSFQKKSVGQNTNI